MHGNSATHTSIGHSILSAVSTSAPAGIKGLLNRLVNSGFIFVLPRIPENDAFKHARNNNVAVRKMADDCRYK